jgi:hypothetical protein
MLGFLAATTEWRPLLPREVDARERFDRARGAGEPRAFRIVTWNVSGGLPLDDVAPLQPDLCLFQEAPFGDVQPRGSWASYQWIPGIDPASLSRHPVRELPSRRVGPWAEPQVFAVQVPGAPVLLMFNVRLVLPSFVVAVAAAEWPWRLRAPHQERLDQFPKLAELVSETLRREDTALAVLCGDFNTPGGARSLEPLRVAGLSDVWPSRGIGWGGTMTSEFPVSRIDQCWVSSGIDVAAAYVRRGRSDHRMLVVDLLLPGR